MRSYDRFSETDRRAIRRWYLVVGLVYGAAMLLCVGAETVKRSSPQWGAITAQAADR